MPSVRLLPRDPRARLAVLVSLATALAVVAYVEPPLAIAIGVFLGAVQVILGLIDILSRGDPPR